MNTYSINPGPLQSPIPKTDILIIRELIITSIFLLGRTQTSSIWLRLIIIPISFALIIITISYNSYSGILIIIYIIIFIRGLLVLLVRVCSLSLQEQYSTLLDLYFLRIVLLSLPVLLEVKSFSTTRSLITIITWFWQQRLIISMIIILLLMSLLVLTYFLQSFKGLVRSI